MYFDSKGVASTVKRIILSVGLAAGLVLALTACGSNAPLDQPVTPSVPTTAPSSSAAAPTSSAAPVVSGVPAGIIVAGCDPDQSLTITSYGSDGHAKPGSTTFKWGPTDGTFNSLATCLSLTNTKPRLHRAGPIRRGAFNGDFTRALITYSQDSSAGSPSSASSVIAWVDPDLKRAQLSSQTGGDFAKQVEQDPVYCPVTDRVYYWDASGNGGTDKLMSYPAKGGESRPEPEVEKTWGGDHTKDSPYCADTVQPRLTNDIDSSSIYNKAGTLVADGGNGLIKIGPPGGKMREVLMPENIDTSGTQGVIDSILRPVGFVDDHTIIFATVREIFSADVSGSTAKITKLLTNNNQEIWDVLVGPSGNNQSIVFLGQKNDGGGTTGVQTLYSLPLTGGKPTMEAVLPQANNVLLAYTG